MYMIYIVYDYKVSIRPENNLFGHAQAFPPDGQDLQENSDRLRGSRAQKGQLKKLNKIGDATYEQ